MRIRTDPFEQAWPLIECWLESEPTASAKALMERLATMMPDVYVGTSQLRTLQRRIKDWRTEQARALVLGHLRQIDDPDGAAAAAPSGSQSQRNDNQTGSNIPL